MSRLALLGADPAFPDGVPLVRPPLPALEKVVSRLAPSYEAGRLTNGPIVRELEERAAVAPRRAPRGRGGDVHLGADARPAGAAARRSGRGPELHLLGLGPRGDVERAGAGVRRVRSALVPARHRRRAATERDGIGAVLATHVFGAPVRRRRRSSSSAPTTVCRWSSTPPTRSARSHGGRAVGGFGAAEVFSLSPTKVDDRGRGRPRRDEPRRRRRGGAHRSRLRQPRRLRHAVRRV